MRVKIYITLEIDPDDYPVPADGNVAEEIEENIQEYLYDMDGAIVRNIKALQE